MSAALEPEALVEPTINPGQGTTDELKAELERLKRERAEFIKNHPGAAGVGGASARLGEWEAFQKYNTLIAKLESRIAERGNSTLPDCNIELFFDGATLTVTGTAAGSFPAVSGTPDASGNFDYSPGRQRQENAGPIPQGTYWIAPKQMKSLWYYVGGPRAAWGSHRITIHPFDSTVTFGRGGFFIHGGAVPGSIGCIDLTNMIDDFAELVAPFGDCKIKLKVDYAAINAKAAAGRATP